MTIKKARYILGEAGNSLDDKQIQDMLASLTYMANKQLDKYELETLGMTIKDIVDDCEEDQ